MKKYGIGIIVLLIISFVIAYPGHRVTLDELEKRAVWLSYLELSSFDYQSQKAFEKDFKDVIETVKKSKGNTVIVHVRPFQDALYTSKYYPVSEYITDRQTLSFDPLKVMIDMAHKDNIKLEAWINPYRVSNNQRSYSLFEKNSPYGLWLNDSRYTIHCGKNEYILNPHSQDVRDYIVAGVKEIVDRYDVDGIHFDDYFYVTGSHKNTTKESRLQDVNLLIKDVYQTIKKSNPKVVFGISPQGNYENCMNSGADIDTWLSQEGYIDYLMPQVYWSNQYGEDGKTELFTQRVKQYASLKKRKEIKLYVGLALYHAGEDLPYDQGWKKSTNNLSSQVQILYEEGYQGYSFFNYQAMKSQAGQKELDNLLSEHQ